MYFEIIGRITDIETIAAGPSIRELARLRKQYGAGHWRKLKGVAPVRLRNGRIRKVELHWYEAHGIGKKKLKIKRYLDESDETTEDNTAIRDLYPKRRLRRLGGA